MELPIDVRFTMTESEFVRAIRRHATRHPFTLFLVILFLVGSGLALVGFAADARAFAGVWTTLAVLAGLYLGWLILISPRQAYDSMNPEVRNAPLNFRFTSSGAELKTDSFQARWDWKLFGHYAESGDHFLIYPRRGNYVLLPKRAFASPESMDSLRALLQEKLRRW